MAGACESVTGRCAVTCSLFSNIPMSRRITMAASGSYDPPPPTAKSQVASVQHGVPTCSPAFDPSSEPQRDEERMRIGQFSQSSTGNPSFSPVEQIHGHSVSANGTNIMPRKGVENVRFATWINAAMQNLKLVPTPKVSYVGFSSVYPTNGYMPSVVLALDIFIE